MDITDSAQLITAPAQLITAPAQLPATGALSMKCTRRFHSVSAHLARVFGAGAIVRLADGAGKAGRTRANGLATVGRARAPISARVAVRGIS